MSLINDRYVSVTSTKDIIELLRLGADINSQHTITKHSALLLALINKHYKTANYLIIHGINIDLQDKYGNTALMLLCMQNDSYHSIKLFRYLLVKNPNIDIQNIEGNSALIYAVKNNHLRQVRILIKNGANINLQNNKGETALMYAVNNNNYYMVKCLLDYNAERGPAIPLINDVNIAMLFNGYTDFIITQDNQSALL